MARPRIIIDQQQFESLCGLMCTLDEIAGIFNCSSDTVERWCKRTYNEGFADVYKKKSAQGKISLRRYQFRQAKTSPAMAIWLGKQWLGQTDEKRIVSEDSSSFEGWVDALIDGSGADED